MDEHVPAPVPVRTWRGETGVRVSEAGASPSVLINIHVCMFYDSRTTTRLTPAIASDDERLLRVNRLI